MVALATVSKHKDENREEGGVGVVCDKKYGMLCLIQCMKAGPVRGAAAHGAIAARLLENHLGQTVLGMSRTQMLIKGTNQEQTSFQNTCRRRRYKHQLPGTFWVNLLPSVCVCV